jgi:DNA-binding transcriptional LysR family regulator
MDLRALRYFVEVVRLQGFTRAADALHVTQPTISKMIRQLEEEVGAPLLLREGRSQRLTDAGRIVFERGQMLLGDFARLRRELAELADLSRGELALGLPPMVGATFFAPVLREFGLRHPGIALRLTEDGARGVERAISQGSVELAVTVLPSSAAGLAGLEFTSEPLHALMPRDAALAGRDSVKLAELADQALILFTESFALSDRILAAYAGLGMTPRIAARSGQWDFIAALVDARLGIALLPAQLCMRLPQDRFAHCALTEPDIPWRLALVWEQGSYLSYAARAFVQLCRSHFGLPETLAAQPVELA